MTGPDITPDQLAQLQAEVHAGDWPAHVAAHLEDHPQRGLADAADLVPPGHPMAGNAAVWRLVADHWADLCEWTLADGGDTKHDNDCTWCKVRDAVVASALSYVESLR